MALVDRAALRLMVITDGRGDFDRIETIARGAVAGGARCVQLRELEWSADRMRRACERLRPLLDGVDGLLLVNGHFDLVAEGLAHGAQIGHRSPAPEVVGGSLGDAGVLSFSAHDPDELERAAAAGCDCATLSPVWPTRSKPGQPAIGPAQAAVWTAAAPLPVLWLGGVTVAAARRIPAIGAAERPIGVAVRSAVCEADDPGRAAADLIDALEGRAAPS